MVFDDLVFDHAHSRFFDCHLGERYTHLVRRHCRFEENFVYLLLGKSGELALRRSYRSDFRFELFD